MIQVPTISRIYLFVIALIVSLLCLGGAAWWGHGKGKASQAAQDAALVARKDAALRAAAGSLTNAAGALRAASDQAHANAAAAHVAQATAARAATQAAKAKHDLTTAQAEWDRRFAHARQQPDCRTVLEMHLCPAVSE